MIAAEGLHVETSGGSNVAKSKARLVKLDVGPIALGELPVLSGILGDLNLLQQVPLLPVANNLLGNLLGGLLGGPVVGDLINRDQPLELDISADIVESNSRASCNYTGQPQLGGSAFIAKLKILGQLINVTGAPNQTVAVLGGLVKVVINEQKKSLTDGAGAIDVNALHIISPAVDIVLSHAHSDIHCDEPVEPVERV